MIPRPLSSTLFPYTTLFRSNEILADSFDRPTSRFNELARLDVFIKDRARRIGQNHFDAAARLYPIKESAKSGQRSARPDTEDRKSTRLNSSHANISYAVFCLNDTSTTVIYPLSLHDALPI